MEPEKEGVVAKDKQNEEQESEKKEEVKEEKKEGMKEGEEDGTKPSLAEEKEKVEGEDNVEVVSLRRESDVSDLVRDNQQMEVPTKEQESEKEEVEEEKKEGMKEGEEVGTKPSLAEETEKVEAEEDVEVVSLRRESDVSDLVRDNQQMEAPTKEQEQSHVTMEEIKEIDKKIDKVEEMIKQEEENYAELEKKINDNEKEPSTLLSSTSKSSTYSSSKGSISLTSSKSSSGVFVPALSDDEDDGKVVAEEERISQEHATKKWISTLVPELLPTLLPEKDVSDEKVILPDEQKIAEMEAVAQKEIMLHADNTIMDRFQGVLKEHLLRQITKLKQNIYEIEGEFKKKETELKVNGESAYREQENIIKQRQTVDSFKTSIEQIMKQRKDLEKEMEEQKETLEFVTQEFNFKKSENIKSRNDAEVLADLVRQMSDYEKKQEHNININRRRTEQFQREKEKYSKEKQAQDMLLWRLNRDLMDKKRAIENGMNRVTAKQKENNSLSEKLLKASIDRAALILENKLITKELQNAFSAIKQRDLTFMSILEELEDGKTCWKQMINSIKWYKEKTKSLLLENENLTHERTRAEKKDKKMESLLRNSFLKKEDVMLKLAALEEMVRLADDDLEVEVRKTGTLEASLSNAVRTIERAALERSKIEKEIMEKLYEQDLSNKTTQHVRKRIEQLAINTRKQEVSMYTMENKLTELMVEVEKGKGRVREVEVETEDVTQKMQDLEPIIRRLQHEKKKALSKQDAMIEMNKAKKRNIKDLEIYKKWKIDVDNPLKTRKRLVEDSVAQLTEAINMNRNLWLELQDGVLGAVDKRGTQLEKINDLRRKLAMMDAALKRAEKQTDDAKKEMKVTMNEMNSHRYKLACLHMTEIKQQRTKHQAQDDNMELQQAFIEILKNLEDGTLEMQREIAEIEEYNAEKTETIEEEQKVLLEWNKKYTMAVDMRKMLDTEKQKGGELAAMRTEIHRMEIRFMNLKRAQERLLTDLELCISRRDSIFDAAEAREKRARLTARHSAVRKLEEKKVRLRGYLRRLRELKKEKEELLSRRGLLSDQLSGWRSTVDQLSDKLEQLEQQIQEGQIHRHRCLEAIVLRQRKAQMLGDLKKGTYKLSHKPEPVLNEANETATLQKNSLITILDNLRNDFPLLALQFLQVKNTLSYPLDPPELLAGDTGCL